MTIILHKKREIAQIISYPPLHLNQYTFLIFMTLRPIAGINTLITTCLRLFKATRDRSKTSVVHWWLKSSYRARTDKTITATRTVLRKLRVLLTIYDPNSRCLSTLLMFWMPLLTKGPTKLVWEHNSVKCNNSLAVILEVTLAQTICVYRKPSISMRIADSATFSITTRWARAWMHQRTWMPLSTKLTILEVNWISLVRLCPEHTK